MEGQDITDLHLEELFGQDLLYDLQSFILQEDDDMVHLQNGSYHPTEDLGSLENILDQEITLGQCQQHDQGTMEESLSGIQFLFSEMAHQADHQLQDLATWQEIQSQAPSTSMNENMEAPKESFILSFKPEERYLVMMNEHQTETVIRQQFRNCSEADIRKAMRKCHEFAALFQEKQGQMVERTSRLLEKKWKELSQAGVSETECLRIIANVDRQLQEKISIALEDMASRANLMLRSIIAKSNNQTPRRSRIPPHAVSILRRWFIDHISKPYPTPGEKEELAQRTGLSRKQVNIWFVNQRTRLARTKNEQRN